MSTRFAVCLLLGLAACKEASSSAAERVTYNRTPAAEPVIAPEPPCKGCTVDAPTSRTGKLPLLVVFHGNNEHAEHAVTRWRDAAVARGFVVLGLECPREDGCTDGIWYTWNGSPQWIAQQINELAHALPIDPSRRYAAGWSGGASYLGMNADKLGGLFSAVVFHGGGQPPQGGDDACPSAALPAYFLVGDANPAHPAAVRLESYLQHCNQQLVWDLLPGAGHPAEDEALDRAKAVQILEWLDRQGGRGRTASST